MLRRFLPLLILGLATCCQASVAYYRSYGPRSVTRLARPTVSWEVWPSEGAKVTAVEMRLNGRPVSAHYDTGHRQLLFTPRDPLSPGEYQVAAKVTVDGELTVSRAWSFKVSSDSIFDLPEATESQTALMNDINAMRAILGLEPTVQDPRLNASAVAHSAYLRKNKCTGHFEQPGTPGFTGNSPSDRMEAFGYFGSSYEDVCTGSRSPHEALRLLFDAPYHRIPFMTPGEVLVGGAYEQGNLTLQFGMSEGEKTVVSPAPGQTGIPTSWDQPEHPNPLRIHNIQGEVGYPIIFAAFGPHTPIKVQSATLRGPDGRSIPLLVNTPGNDDHLDNAAILMAKSALQPDTVYRVEVHAQDSEGSDLSKSWSFRTGSK